MTSPVAEGNCGDGRPGARPEEGRRRPLPAGEPDRPARGVPPARTAPLTPATPPAQPRAPAEESRPLPPGQHVSRVWPVLHYGRVPVFRPERWDLCVCGVTASGGEYRWDWAELSGLPRIRVTADLHCVTRFTVPDLTWEGVAGADLLRLAPPAPQATHIMVWADFGYGANIPIEDFADDRTVLATHVGGAQLPAERGFPVRLVVPHRYAWKSVKWVRVVEYMTQDRRGFWEERGYHNLADPWREQRFSYQEETGEGPPL